MISSLIILFAAGILSVGFLPVLPSLFWLLLILPLSVLSWRSAIWCWPLAFALGLAWGLVYGHHQLSHRLSPSLVGQDIVVSGWVRDLPQADARRQRFVLEVDIAESLQGEPLPFEPRQLLLSWYGGEPLTSGEYWQLTVRLRRPRGFVNPGGFDYQVWLMRRGIHAVGYVRDSDRNRHQAEASMFSVDFQRFELRRWLLERASHPEQGILLALLVGDRSLIPPERWRLLQDTGTNHLIAISGLHVGFVALLGFMLGLGVGRVLNLFWHACPALVPAYLCAIACAVIYGALAGFSLPTQRAMTMVLVVQLAFLLRRTYRTRDVFLVALALVLLGDPLAAFDMGFWLSFGAVAVLIFGFAGRLVRPGRLPGSGLVRAQWLIFVGLLVPLALLLHSTALIAPLANILAIPLVTFLLVPPLLLAAATQTLLPGLSSWLLQLAEWGLGVLLIWLESLASLAPGHLNPVLDFGGWSLLLAMLGVLLVLMPSGIPGRWLGYPSLLLAVLVPARVPPSLQVTYLEVGQGLATVVLVEDRALVFDTGPAFSERFDAGTGIVAPYLRRAGVRQLDKLVISHRHSDHAGGAPGVMAALPVKQLLLGEPNEHRELVSDGAQSCHDFSSWEWHGVHFRFLQWRIAANASANNRSCVLLIEYGADVILLTGDIERPAERHLLRYGLLPADIKVLQVPHHGSRSSSTQEFVEWLRPEFAVYSAGFNSRHGHPHPEVVERYESVGTIAFNTATNGAVELLWRQDRPLEVRAWRQYRQRYWYD